MDDINLKMYLLVAGRYRLQQIDLTVRIMQFRTTELHLVRVLNLELSSVVKSILTLPVRLQVIFC